MNNGSFSVDYSDLMKKFDGIRDWKTRSRIEEKGIMAGSMYIKSALTRNIKKQPMFKGSTEKRQDMQKSAKVGKRNWRKLGEMNVNIFGGPKQGYYSWMTKLWQVPKDSGRETFSGENRGKLKKIDLFQGINYEVVHKRIDTRISKDLDKYWNKR